MPEESLLLSAFMSLRKEFSGLRLVLAPRNPARARRILRLGERVSLPSILWSRSFNPDSRWEVLVVDEIGILPSLYLHADVVVIGGSLTDRGGHNFLEAAREERAIVVGPHMQNFDSLATTFQRSGALARLEDTRQLVSVLRDLLSHPGTRKDLGSRAAALLASLAGVSANYACALERILENSDEGQ